mmetsp:Transcript_2483/g.7098  ORF Transcript_2483/g.7098 Transcript_2483/m.7098 type:complete len:224 (-) Transcript_2483:354-1025(-)
MPSSLTNEASTANVPGPSSSSSMARPCFANNACRKHNLFSLSNNLSTFCRLSFSSRHCLAMSSLTECLKVFRNSWCVHRNVGSSTYSKYRSMGKPRAFATKISCSSNLALSLLWGPERCGGSWPNSGGSLPRFFVSINPSSSEGHCDKHSWTSNENRSRYNCALQQASHSATSALLLNNFLLVGSSAMGSNGGQWHTTRSCGPMISPLNTIWRCQPLSGRLFA